LNDNLPLAQEFFNRIEDLTIYIYYESIFKEKWMYDGENTIRLEKFEGLLQKEQFDG